MDELTKWDGWVHPSDMGLWAHLADTPAAAEEETIKNGSPWTVTALAGLQYHGWRQDNGMDGQNIPQPGDRLQLVREPDNAYDANAVRVEWRNGIMLGHLPRIIARDVATDLDAGVALRAYVRNARADGPKAWALKALLVGTPVTAQHEQWAADTAHCTPNAKILAATRAAESLARALSDWRTRVRAV